jgi:polar amino acid transport system substrate-binding protein
MAWKGFDMRKHLIPIAAFLVAILGTPPAVGQPEQEFVHDGTLRVGVPVFNPVLAGARADGSVAGVANDLGRMIAAKLGARFQLVRYESTEAFAKSFGASEWDIAIGPKTPLAEKSADLSSAFMLVDNFYAAAPGRQFADVSEVDRPGVKIAVVVNSAPDQYLGTALKNATLFRFQGGTPEVVQVFRAGEADVYASNIENLTALSNAMPGTRIVPGPFRSVSMVVAFPKGKSAEAARMLRAWVGEAKATGLILKSIESAGVRGVRVAD